MKQGDQFHHQFVVTQSLYQGFINIFKDNNPLHTNTEFAQRKGFNDKVMHGNILNGFISYFIGECLPTKDVIIHSQSIRFAHPVYLNQTLDFKSEISNYSESVKTYEFKFSFINEYNKSVAKGLVQIGLI